MPTRKIQISCPNCRVPQVIEAQQIFDVQQEPNVKQRMLSGAPNLLRCAACGYQGPIHMPVVYHDADKEFLLTHVPQDLGLPMHEQERVIGSLIQQVLEALPPEKRRAYLLQPRTMLTMQTMVDTILAADGISKEAVEAQQGRVQLLQRLANLSTDDAIREVARQEDAAIDREFFSIVNTLVSNALSAGDEALARRLVEVQRILLPVTTYGQEVQRQNEEVQAAAQELQDLGERLTRETLLDLVLKAESDLRIRAYVSMARGGMDYEFFKLLSERIDRARPEARQRLSKLREQLLELTRQFDEQAAQQAGQMKQLLEALLQESDPRAVLMENPDIVNELFLSVLESELTAARAASDQERGARLQKVVQVVDELAKPPEEVEWINRLVMAEDDPARQAILVEMSPEQLAAVVEMMLNLLPQVEASGDAETVEAVRSAYRLALRRSMALKLKN